MGHKEDSARLIRQTSWEKSVAIFLYVYSSWYCRAMTGNPRCFCKTR